MTSRRHIERIVQRVDQLRFLETVCAAVGNGRAGGRPGRPTWWSFPAGPQIVDLETVPTTTQLLALARDPLAVAVLVEVPTRG